VSSDDVRTIADLGRILGSPSRAALLSALLGGTAHTPTELGRHLRLSLSTVSEHLSTLVDAGLVVVEPQGRHRYVRLADQRVAGLLERMATFDVGRSGAAAGPMPRPRLPAELVHARSCYGHLAGTLGVRLFGALLAGGQLRWHDATLHLTDEGTAFLKNNGIAVGDGARPLARPCLDWSQRTHHLAGRAGDALLSEFLERGWLRRRPERPRALLVTDAGRRGFPTLFHMEV
jgi:DNA-binding transcriptional ArsR family regulator